MATGVPAEPRNVVLVGFMGAGKSTIGRLLARRLGLCFVETDDIVTAREGKSIPDIFAEHGEARFRALEAFALDAIEEKHGHVIATGGGFPCRPGVMPRLRALGTVVWLAAELDVLHERATRVGGRPMLSGRSREELATLYEARQPYYREAHLAVDVSRLGPDVAVSQLIRALRERARSAAGLAAGGLP